MTSTTIRSGGYLFTYSVDGWWSAYPGGQPTGRIQPVQWPAGVDAQTLTAGPGGVLPAQTSASITLRRADGQPFDLQSFTGKLLLNTAGAGGAFEIMPQLNGNDAFANPQPYDCTGYAGMSFPYAPALTGYDTYIISMWGDFALTQLTVVDASLPSPAPPTLQMAMLSANSFRLNWPTNSTGFTVQQNSSLGTTNWVSVTNAVSFVGTNYQADIPTAGGARFFRLMHP